ncbi:ral guanine nucleotide dissociation stimulator-like 3 isoform X2 [Carettochelys insculpta]|uniref:ral guanine nucleotide dissociation stimulator-like 3 isoform X2 n=1 Tax=Carettochelys insculpta TaxID=44489 RepID=UPI003EBFE56D
MRLPSARQGPSCRCSWGERGWGVLSPCCTPKLPSSLTLPLSLHPPSEPTPIPAWSPLLHPEPCICDPTLRSASLAVSQTPQPCPCHSPPSALDCPGSQRPCSNHSTPLLLPSRTSCLRGGCWWGPWPGLFSHPQEPLQEWGEELEDGAIYSVTLQRVRAEAVANGGPCLLAGAGAPCPFIQYRTCKLRRLRAGTLPRLVRGLVSAEAESDPAYVPSFLATYRAFATPGRVLELLLPLGPHRAVLQVLELWLCDHSEDFWEPPQHPSLCQLHSYIHQVAPGSEGCVQADGLLKSFQEKAGGEQAEPEGCDSPGLPALGVEAGAEGCGEPPELLSFSAEEVAEQLTLMDVPPLPQELFVQVQPFHCLGCVWSQRDRKGGRGAAPSVRATVAQFNAVAGCVVSSVLHDVQLRAPQRARLLEKWVAIAQHCCVLRNFSSLRAVLSALQSSPIHRLKRTWAAVSRDATGTFRKLSQMSDERDHLSCREILLQGDAAQGVSNEAASPRCPRRPSPPEKLPARPPGTVPYLGTFLTDLVMLDTALPDFLEGGLINFEKRRKEAEVLLRIRRLQASCGGYALRPNAPLLAAFQRQGRLSEEHSYRISQLIEPPADSCPSSPRVRRSLSKRFSSLLLGAEAVSPRLPSPKGDLSPLGTSNSCEAEERPSTPCSPDAVRSLCKSLLELPLSTCPPEEQPAGLAPRPRSPLSRQQGADSRIVRVSLENAQANLYRSILLTSQDKTSAVVQRALQKHGLEGAPPAEFQLLQLLGGSRELLIPDGANAFYAMNPAANFDFVLRRRGPPTPSSPRPPRPSPSHRAPLPPDHPSPADPPLPLPTATPSPAVHFTLWGPTPHPSPLGPPS